MAQVKERVDVYSLVTNQIIEQLENNIVPWRLPWKDSSIPQNLTTRKPYRGINLLLLGFLRYEQNLFLTFNQLKAIGGSVKKGAKGNLIIFWKPILKTARETNKDEPELSFVLRYYKVFNVAQCENIPTTFFEEITSIPFCPIGQCDRILEEMGNCPKIIYEAQEAFYERVSDYINMPKPETFVSNDAFYSVLFHELVHSTGHRTRVGRDGIATSSRFGDSAYSLEELIAEIGACFLTSLCGIGSKNFDQSVSYINGWLKALKNDKKLIVTASGQAQKAVDYILNVPQFEEV